MQRLAALAAGARFRPGDRPAIALYAGVLAGSALLVFWIQPFFGRALLPHAGGAAGVWLTAIVFFQAALLAGYAYAHLLRTRLPLTGQISFHLLMLALAAFFFLPPGLSPDFSIAPDGSPALAILAALLVHLGLPFAALSATAPLLQHWFATQDHPQAENPYRLYAASNAGSLGALAAYPFLIEPLASLATQALVWSALYGLVMAGTLAAGLTALMRPRATALEKPEFAASAGKWRERAGWFLCAALPTALLAAVTAHITTDVAAFPLLWVLPLGLYLATYIAAFAGLPSRAEQAGLAAGPALAFFVVSIWFSQAGFAWPMAAHLAGFAAMALACHATLYAKRPAPARATEFFLILAAGGVTGTAATAFLPPMLLSTPLEYPLLIALACFALPGRATKAMTSKAGRRKLSLAFGAALLAIAVVFVLPSPAGLGPVGVAFLFVAILAAAAFAFALAARFPLLLAALFLGGWFMGPASGDAGNGTAVWNGRSFFGHYAVETDRANQGFHFLMGTTAHGFERQDRFRERPEPATYYHARGPLGQAMAALGHRFERIGVLGLGIGNMGCHAREGQSWTYFEIDPLVVRVAQDRRFFHSLASCTPQARIVTGDGRLMLSREPEGAFDFIVMDAFSSNAVPIHLITREAFETYGRALADDGLLLVNVSNRHLDLAPVVARAAEKAGFKSLEQNFDPGPRREGEVLALASHWVALSRDEAALTALAASGNWNPARRTDRTPLWTDDHASIFGALY
ncbi:spermidine synthase [Parvibaculum sp.]|uniref:spermidine synthase n=1 Tax=Parvibaculum sp. TaxID=2024848 RepID=UPI00391C3D26